MTHHFIGRADIIPGIYSRPFGRDADHLENLSIEADGTGCLIRPSILWVKAAEGLEKKATHPCRRESREA